MWVWNIFSQNFFFRQFTSSGRVNHTVWPSYSHLVMISIVFQARCNSTNAFRILMEMQEKEYSSGKTYDTLRIEWLPKFLHNHPDWMDVVCKPFVEAKGQNWQEFKDFLVSPGYKCDEIGLLVFARMYHIHIAVIVNDRVWTTHHEHALRSVFSCPWLQRLMWFCTAENKDWLSTWPRDRNTTASCQAENSKKTGWSLSCYTGKEKWKKTSA